MSHMMSLNELPQAAPLVDSAGYARCEASAMPRDVGCKRIAGWDRGPCLICVES